jgi:hypothetical protein
MDWLLLLFAEWLFSAEFFLFNVALLLVLLLASMESLHLYFKLSPAQAIQQLLPKLQQQYMQRLDIAELSFFNYTLIWLVSFAVAGYFLQVLCFYFTRQFVDSIWLIIPTLYSATFLSKLLAHWLNQLLPAVPSTKPSTELSLLGRVATVYKGTARSGMCALARVRDESGHLHYVQVEPEFGELPLHSEVILFSKNDAVYLAKLLPEEHIPSSN